MSPGQRHCSLPGPARSGSRLARSLHLLPLAALQPVRNDAVSAPLPPFAPDRGSEQGAGRRVESARGEEGRIRRKHPEAPPAGRAGRSRCRLHRGARGTEAEEGAEEAAAGRDARGQGVFAVPCAALLAWLVASGSSSQGFAPEDVEAPDSGVRAPVLSLSREPKLCKRPGIGAFPKEKQTVTNTLGARASSSPPGLTAFFPGFLYPNAVSKACQTRPKDPASAPFFLPSPSFPFFGLVHLTLSTNNLIPTLGKSLLKSACPCPSFPCPAYHKITTYSEKDLYSAGTLEAFRCSYLWRQ